MEPTKKDYEIIKVEEYNYIERENQNGGKYLRFTIINNGKKYKFNTSLDNKKIIDVLENGILPVVNMEEKSISRQGKMYTYYEVSILEILKSYDFKKPQVYNEKVLEKYIK